jgi:hypothetical protein
MGHLAHNRLRTGFWWTYVKEIDRIETEIRLKAIIKMDIT